MASVQALTSQNAARWGPSTLVRAAPVVLVFLWVVVFAAAVAGDTTQCTPADPSVCGPSTANSLELTVCFATPVLLLWLPVLGCLAGLAFGLTDALLDSDQTARIAFGLHGALCLAALAALLVSQRTETAAGTDAAAGGTALAPPRRPRPLWFVPLGLVVGGVAVLAWYAHLDAAEATHVRRSELVQAQVTSVDSDNTSVTLALDGRTLTVGVLDLTPYPVSATVPVRIDPADTSWARLVAEPYDASGWESAGLGVLLLAVLAGTRLATAARSRTHQQSVPQPALRVSVVTDQRNRFLVMPIDSETPVGRLSGAVPPIRSRTDPREAVLLGMLRDRGHVTLTASDGVVLAQGTLRLRPTGSVRALAALRPRFQPDAPLSAIDFSVRVPGELVEPTAAPVPDLPLKVPNASAVRLGGLALVSGALVGAPVALALLTHWYSVAIVVVVGLGMLLDGSRRLRSPLVLTRERLIVTGGNNLHAVPWDAMTAVRRNDDRLLISWRPAGLVEVGPLEGGAERAAEVGAAMLALQQRSLAAGAPGRDVTSRAYATPLVPLYVLLVMVGLYVGYVS